ncbi:RNA polymerase II mediator complex subunit [Fusarium piperis]|uniref:Mediator of RNA polymerase II transcription subunit 17 n=1 Tax=Fusarium piperis TaxID=1435070 RepID=A0A9W8TBP0_9HYPO|nr:RNA polymerase II mediator complex subunit [Fusarium piperis]
MAPGHDDQPLSLRPNPVADCRPKNIADFITRVNAQPGGFRALSEDKLREDIAARGAANGDAEDKDVDMTETGQDEEDEDDEDQETTRDPQEVRMEVLRNIDIAGNTAFLTLDFLSLLLSKQNPTQAGVTLSQGLRDITGIGTMGFDKLDDPTVSPTKAKDHEDVAVGWTMMEVNKTRDAAESACKFLEKEIAAEGRYWDEIVAVQDSGWSISRVPKERHTLGVRFGFSEAAPEFRNNGLAPMRRGDDGAVQLDCGRLGGVSERLVVTLEKDGKVIGRSALPAQTIDDAPLEARVLEARNTIFSQELWYEIRREARNLAAYDVKPDGSRLTCDLDPVSKTKLTIELVPLGSQPLLDDSLPENDMAEIAAISLHILLISAHRHTELLRTRPVPPYYLRARGQQQPHSLVRPVIALFMHYRHLFNATTHVGRIVQSLRRAGLPANFILLTPRPSAPEPGSTSQPLPSFSQTIVRNVIPPVDFNLRLTIAPGAVMDVRGRTFLMPVTATYYQIMTPPNSLVARICAPYREGYPTPEALYDYLSTATARVLAEHFRSLLASSLSSTRWVKSIKGDSIRDADKEEFEMRFALAHGPKLLLTGTSQVEGKTLRQEWEWTADFATEPASLQHVVQREAKKAFPE